MRLLLQQITLFSFRFPCADGSSRVVEVEFLPGHKHVAESAAGFGGSDLLP